MSTESMLPPDSLTDDYDWMFSESEPKDAVKPAVLSEELLFSALLRRTAEQIWPNDAVVHDFVAYVAAPLSANFAHITAKGGDFVRQQLQQGKAEAEVERYKHDQSMRAHLVNGLFPVLHIARTLQRWGAPQFRFYDDTVRRVFLAGYLLHDYLKLPTVKDRLDAAGLTHDTLNPAKHRPLVEAILRDCCGQLGLDAFLAPVGGVELLLHDLIYIISNTQLRWGTLRNLSALPGLHLPGVQRDLCEQLSRLADYIAYAAGTTPREVVAHGGLRRELATLSNGQAELVYHHIADVRGVITNLIQNAALAAWQSDDCVPILYAPSGVVYLARRGNVQSPDVIPIANDVVRRVKEISSHQLRNNLTGFSRDGKGLKHADYYHLFFNRFELLTVGFNAAFKIIHDGKAASAGKRFDKLAGWMETGLDAKQVDDLRVDQLAEWCYLAEKTVADLPGGAEAPRLLIEAMELGDLYQDFLAVPRDARAGGVGYHWYFVAGHYFARNRQLEPQAWRARMAEFVRILVEHLQQQVTAQSGSAAPFTLTDASEDGFADLRQYVLDVLSFGPLASAGNAVAAGFTAELARYTNAKKARGRTPICSLCSSPYSVNKQQEAAILFAPQVYSNKLALHGSDAIRDICSICSTEIMLRQLLMNDTSVKGKDFEGRNLRYLYFYPNYFFTPETLALFRVIHDQLRNISFTELRRQLVNEQAETNPLLFEDPAVWQRLNALLLTPEPPLPGQDRLLRLHFPEHEPITFYFLGLPPPGRDAKDAESWVNPAFLAFVLPLCLDIKVVASASSIPVLNEAGELSETVLLDGAHAAISYITGGERFNLNQIEPMLKRLTTTYLIHLDGNSEPGGKDFYRWQDLPALARRLAESPLYAFHYLKKWQRNARLDSLPPAKVRLYLAYYQHIAQERGDDMNHAKALTELFWKFYRAKRKQGRLNSNSILRPINVAAKALLSADRRIFNDPESLTTLVRGELSGFLDRVDSRRADGYVPKIEVNGRKVIDEQAVNQFADYWVNTLYFGALRGDLSALRGKQLNLLKNACEVIYRDLDAQYWASQGTPAPADEMEDDEVIEELTV
jgi:CRISPR-associated protein Csc3